jgi:hypothetical protein
MREKTGHREREYFLFFGLTKFGIFLHMLWTPESNQAWSSEMCIWSPKEIIHIYRNTLAALTLILLFLEMFKFFKKYVFSKTRNLWRKIETILEYQDYFIFQHKISTLINFSSDMCSSFPFTIAFAFYILVVAFRISKKVLTLLTTWLCEV